MHEMSKICCKAVWRVGGCSPRVTSRHIVRQKGFWSEDDDEVLKAIHDGFVSTHHAMWKEYGNDTIQ